MKLFGLGSVVNGSKAIEFVSERNQLGNTYLVRLESGKMLSLKEIERFLLDKARG